MQFYYHYTTIETLEKILSTKTIRFNCLEFVDDPQETETKNILHAGRLCVVSCWTEEDTESLPMWNMYTPDMTGVRLKMREFPFKDKENIFNGKEPVDKSYKNEVFHYRAFEIYDNLERNIISVQGDRYHTSGIYGAEVTYIDEEGILKPHVPDVHSLEHIIGLYKNTSWKFQQEWRYLILLVPEDLMEYDGRLYSVDKTPFQDYYADLSDAAFEESEILLGPKASEAQKAIVEALVEKYVGKGIIKIEKSRLRVK